jgi:hypothetical protein
MVPSKIFSDRQPSILFFRGMGQLNGLFWKGSPSQKALLGNGYHALVASEKDKIGVGDVKSGIVYPGYYKYHVKS